MGVFAWKTGMNPVQPDPKEVSIPADELASVASPDVQKHAARMAQDAFSGVFRLTLGEDEAGRVRGVAALAEAVRNWSNAAADDAACGLRLAMVVLGLDQWGLAYSRAFGLQAIPGLTELVGALRTSLDPREEAHFQLQFDAVDACESNAIDFKIDLRRSIHLALWHAMIACEDRVQAQAILTQLGGMMFALIKLMPDLGWRLVADTIASIQIQCLSNSLATEGLAREMNEALFDALSRELPATERNLAMAHATRSVIAWQQANRASSNRIH